MALIHLPLFNHRLTIVGLSLDPHWTLLGPFLDLRWTPVGPSLDSHWILVGHSLDHLSKQGLQSEVLFLSVIIFTYYWGI